MSGRKVALLAVMAILDCLVLCVGGVVIFLIIPGSDPAAVLAALQPPATTRTPIPSATAIQPPTATVTPSPTVTITPSPTATPVPGWVNYSGNKLSLWLPDGYIAGDPVADKVRMEYDLSVAGFELDTLDVVFNSDPPFQFVALNKIHTEEDYSLVLAVFDQGTADQKLEAYIVTLISQEAADYYFLNRTELSLDRYFAVRYSVEHKENRTVREFRYFIKDEYNRFWQLSYSAFNDYFGDHANIFEKSALTFRALP